MKRANVNNQAAKAAALAVARAMGTGLAAAWVVTAVGAGRAWAVVGRHSRLPNSLFWPPRLGEGGRIGGSALAGRSR